MYYDIIQVEDVDEMGNSVVHFEPRLIPPVYDDIKPSDMSLENQKKAGISLVHVYAKDGSRLTQSDSVSTQLINKGETLVPVEVVDNDSQSQSSSSSEPSSEPKSE